MTRSRGLLRPFPLDSAKKWCTIKSTTGVQKRRMNRGAADIGSAREPFTGL